MSLPEVEHNPLCRVMQNLYPETWHSNRGGDKMTEVSHNCEKCDNYVPEMLRDIGRPCIHQKRIAKDRFCVDFKEKCLSSKKSGEP